MSTTLRLASAAALALLLAACGGSDSASAPSPALPGATAPTIAAQPAAVTATEGEAARFSVTAAGSAPLAYQWKRGGVDIAGATASTYTLAATTLADNGAAFSVTVSNSGGSVNSTAATLTVSARPVSVTIIAAPQSLAVAELQTVTLSVGAVHVPVAAQRGRRDMERHHRSHGRQLHDAATGAHRQRRSVPRGRE
jgi:hypothetical protein